MHRMMALFHEIVQIFQLDCLYDRASRSTLKPDDAIEVEQCQCIASLWSMSTFLGTPCRSDDLVEEGQGGRLIAGFKEIEIHSVSVLIDSAIQVILYTLDFHLGFIHSLGSRYSIFSFPESLLQLRCICQKPAVEDQYVMILPAVEIEFHGVQCALEILEHHEQVSPFR
ncbi:hypothetical protein [Candidatus Enterovibrio escicola]|uniref:hypothetical protein n=1 Tax=Candidatus Enterovibrio escicola TaxID=1927127 RepID=UPI001680D2A4|nr:hypothetical protein [Candidatus Enterovibrio escacola]